MNTLSFFGNDSSPSIVDRIHLGDKLAALHIKVGKEPFTRFYTDRDKELQIGQIVYGPDHDKMGTPLHLHRGTAYMNKMSEIIILLNGALDIRLCHENHSCIVRVDRESPYIPIFVIYDVEHAVQAVDNNAAFLEIKQGPFDAFMKEMVTRGES